MREGDDGFVVRVDRLPAGQSAAIVMVNGEARPWRPWLTVADVLVERGDDARVVATAVNARFVPREARGDTPLWPGDRLVVFSAIVGG